MELKGINYIYTDSEITDIIDNLFDKTNYKYYRIDKNGWLIGKQNIKENALKTEIYKLFFEVRNINRWLTGETISPSQEPTLNEIEEKENERKTKYNKLSTLLKLGYNIKNQQITIPDNVLNWLQENGFIENATAKPLKWLKTKQTARELLTHDKIKGNLTIADVERQTPNLFVYYKDGKPLTLAKDKPVPSLDSDNLRNFLATL